LNDKKFNRVFFDVSSEWRNPPGPIALKIET
jgi:hypothetical protein